MPPSSSSGGNGSSASPPPSGPAQTGIPQESPVVLLVEENHSYPDVIGNLTAMPYLNQLGQQYVIGTQYFANQHPSIGNYMELITGKAFPSDDSFNGTIPDDNIVRALLGAGKSWKSYAESLPSAGYTGGDQGAYVRRHNPFVYLQDVVNTSQRLNVVPFSQFAADLASGTLPNFSFIAPNLNHDAHDCPQAGVACTDTQKLVAADTWLQQNIAPLISSPAFSAHGLLIIVFDEGNGADNAHGGGQVPFVAVGPDLKRQYLMGTFYQHQSTLRTIMAALGLTQFLGDAATAPPMTEMFR